MLKRQKSKARPKPGKRPARGTLMLIASLLILSAAIRVSDDAGRAFALSNEADTPDAIEPGDTAEVCEPAPDVAEVLKALRDRETQIKQREAQIAEKMQALSVADQAIEERLVALQEAEESLRATLAIADSAAEDDLTRLTAVYESMKPKEAAALFEQMDPQFAAGFLGRMQPAAAAGVMAGLTPDTAYAVSVILAGRNALVPKN